MGKRRMTTIRVDEDSLRRAHELRFNVSRITENAIKELIRRIESPNNPKEPNIAQITPNKGVGSPSCAHARFWDQNLIQRARSNYIFNILAAGMNRSMDPGGCWI